jgi:hypothetical protein
MGWAEGGAWWGEEGCSMLMGKGELCSREKVVRESEHELASSPISDMIFLSRTNSSHQKVVKDCMLLHPSGSF